MAELESMEDEGGGGEVEEAIWKSIGNKRGRRGHEESIGFRPSFPRCKKEWDSKKQANIASSEYYTSGASTSKVGR